MKSQIEKLVGGKSEEELKEIVIETYKKEAFEFYYILTNLNDSARRHQEERNKKWTEVYENRKKEFQERELWDNRIEGHYKLAKIGELNLDILRTLINGY